MRAASPRQWLLRHSLEAFCSGEDTERGEALGTGALGRGRGEWPHNPREVRTKQAGDKGHPLTQAERGPGTGARGCCV